MLVSTNVCLHEARRQEIKPHHFVLFVRESWRKEEFVGSRRSNVNRVNRRTFALIELPQFAHERLELGEFNDAFHFVMINEQTLAVRNGRSRRRNAFDQRRIDDEALDHLLKERKAEERGEHGVSADDQERRLRERCTRLVLRRRRQLVRCEHLQRVAQREVRHLKVLVVAQQLLVVGDDLLERLLGDLERDEVVLDDAQLESADDAEESERDGEGAVGARVLRRAEVALDDPAVAVDDPHATHRRAHDAERRILTVRSGRHESAHCHPEHIAAVVQQQVHAGEFLIERSHRNTGLHGHKTSVDIHIQNLIVLRLKIQDHVPVLVLLATLTLLLAALPLLLAALG
mmetsp:Transcript_16041/g.23525  ORF Transcript_16041/g.23525 Transcript_16041/m.23525 type:complete len:345 (+) Transcript_16041:549-1583(+)